MHLLARGNPMNQCKIPTLTIQAGVGILRSSDIMNTLTLKISEQAT